MNKYDSLLQVENRDSETQPQVVENFNKLTPKIFVLPGVCNVLWAELK